MRNTRLNDRDHTEVVAILCRAAAGLPAESREVLREHLRSILINRAVAASQDGLLFNFEHLASEDLIEIMGTLAERTEERKTLAAGG